MIEININQESFEQDIRSLLMAFFPGEEMTTQPDEDAAKKIRIRIEEEQILILTLFDNHKIEDEVTIEEAIKSNRFEIKNTLKRLLYHILVEQTGKTLPWGTLTGIRPTKIPMALLEEGKKPDWIYSKMKEDYLAESDKLHLCLEIAERELEILKDVDYKKGYSLYIGIPFCPTTCLYCSFTSYPIAGWEKRIEEYLEALFIEIDYVKMRFKDKKLNTIYFGGGTPTSLSAEHLDQLLAKVCDSFDLGDLKELTVEAGRPDSITLDKLKVLRRHPVSRISINPQTMKEETLRLIGRNHTIQQVRDTFLMAREQGFDNINMDLILGLPGETPEDVKYTLEEIRKMSPDSITVHSLAIKRAARLNICKEKYADLQMVNTDEMITMTGNYAREMGLAPYYLYRQKNMAGNFENVGYAAKGKAGIYNILIMEEKQTILAIGAGSSSKIVFPEENRITRIENLKDVELYISRIDEMIERKEKILANL